MNTVVKRPSGFSKIATALAMAMLLLSAHTSFQTTVLARTLPQLIIVLDSSSSMEDELDGELKYKMVRRAVSKALPSFDGKLQTGLLVFGSKQKKSCTDIVSPMPPTSLVSKSLSVAINSRKPLGKSPIGASLAKAANMTNSLATRSDILLIADGSDNCRVNVCSVATALAERSPATRIHVIGIGRTGTINRLDCISRATNGLFFAVGSQSKMISAMQKVMREVQSKKPPPSLLQRTVAMLIGPPPAPARRPPHKIARYNKVLPPVAPVSVKTLAAKRLLAKKAVRQKSTRLKKRNLNKRGIKKQALLKKSSLEHAPIITAGLSDKAVKRSQTASGPTPVKWLSFSDKAPPPLMAKSKQAQKSTSRAKPIIIAQNQTQQLSNITGRTAFLGDRPAVNNKLVQSSTPVKLGALITEEGQQIKNGLVWRIYNASKSRDGRYKLVKSLESPRFNGSLPLGVYLVNLSWGRSHLTEKMELLSSKPFAHNFILNAGGLRLGARHMDGTMLSAQKVIYRIYSDERDQFGRRRLVLDHARPDKTIRLNAGIYHVSSLYGTANGIIESDLTIEAGKLTKAIINHTASKVTFKLVNQPGGEALAGAIWRIETPDGKLIKETAGALPTLILAAGDYTINANYSGRAFARKVSIEPGAPVHVEIVIQ